MAGDGRLLQRPLFSRRRKIIIPRNMLHVTYGVKYGHRMTWRKIWPPVTRIIRCKIYDPSITRTIRCKYIASLIHVMYGVKYGVKYGSSIRRKSVTVRQKSVTATM
jgi:hypothetical protein